MALATRCPHCKTTFRVANDQLKLRAGLVRCGACKEIFNGIEHLLRPETPQRLPEQTAPASPASAAHEPPLPSQADPVAAEASLSAAGRTAPDTTGQKRNDDEAPDLATFLRPQAPGLHATYPHERPAQPAATSYAFAAHHDSHAGTDPLQRMTLIDFSYADDYPSGLETAAPASPGPDQPDPLDEAIEALQRKPLRGAKKPRRKSRPEDDEEIVEPGFVRQARRRARTSSWLQPLLLTGSAMLLLLLIVQGAYVFRSQLAVQFPSAKPALGAVCALLRCEVGLPMEIDQVSIESSELQNLAPDKNAFALTVLLRNRSTMVQAWPNIELTLNDANEQPIARRVFTPAEYAGKKAETGGFAGRSEQSFKLLFELSQIKASGYRVYLFYP